MGRKKDLISWQAHSLASCAPLVFFNSLAYAALSIAIRACAGVLRRSFVSAQAMRIHVWANRIATFLLFVSPSIFKRTLSAYTKSLMFANKPYVILSKCVSFIAMCFACVICTWTKSTQIILSACNRFQVRRIATTFNATQMVNVQGMFNVLNKQTVQYAMSGVIKSINTELPIMTRVAVAPYPTRGMVAHIFNGDTSKNFRQQVSENVKFAIIESSHSVYSFIVNGLVRVVERMTVFSRPVLL